MNWINVKDKLPDDYNKYLVVVETLNGYRDIKIRNLNPSKTGFYVTYDAEGESAIEKVTHWMPKPELP